MKKFCKILILTRFYDPNFKSGVLRRLLQWQRDHNCLIEILYINTKVKPFQKITPIKTSVQENPADQPSRVIYHDEPAISDQFLRLIEADLGIQFTFDTCSHRGVSRSDHRGKPLRYW